MSNLNKWYKRLGAFLIGFAVFTAALFFVRFTLLKSIGFVIFLDDFLTIGISNVLLFPCGIWLLYIGTHPHKYVKVNSYPLVLISVSPICILSIAFCFLMTDVIGFRFKSSGSFGEAYTLAVYFSIILICALAFISGNILLLCQLVKSRSAIKIRLSGSGNK